MQHPDTPVNYGKSLGRVAFEAYRESKPVAFNGDDVPGWDDIGGDKEATHKAWEDSARAVADMVINNRTKDYRPRV